MTSTAASAAAGSAARVHPLWWLLMLAALLRLPLAFWPNAYAPDEIFQWLEPAWRVLGHDSIISWEWRHGIRGWALPTLLAAPMALGDWLAPGGAGGFVGPRLATAIASLSIVASAWLFGARISRLHAVVAAFVTGIWFELVFFAPHTLGEPLATAAILPAAWLLTELAPTRRQLAAAGMLLALAFVCRFQYAPAVAVLVAATSWRHWRRLLPLGFGAAMVLALAGGIDALQGTAPFAWLIANIRSNLLDGRASEAYGGHPFGEYLGNLMVLWSVAILPLALAVWRGWRRAPWLLGVALVNLLFHSLISHKEHRFIFLSGALLVLLAALGSADWIAQLRQRRGWSNRALPFGLGLWLLVSAGLAATGPFASYWSRGIGAATLAGELRHDPEMCGLALYEIPFFMLVGRERLAGAVPVYSFDARDPAVGVGAAAAAATVRAQPGFNRMLARQSMASELPPDFREGSCAMFYDAKVCIYARKGSCDPAPATTFLLNDVLTRIDL
jgi:phosphatidylinositol glycan class B